MPVDSALAAPRVTLPRGRHALPPEEVTASQRLRLLRAMTEVVAERGFAATTAARVYQRAGVSSRAFYENFADVRDGFLAAYDESVRITEAAMLEPLSPSLVRPPLARFAAMLDTYLELLIAEPAVARTFLVEVYAAGPAALQRRLAVHRRFVRTVGHVLAPDGGLAADDLFAVESLVDAITFRVTRGLLEGVLDADVRQLHDDLLALTCRLCPWLDEQGKRL